MSTKVFVIHGIFSKSENLQDLAKWLTDNGSNLTAEALDYDWRRPILETAPKLLEKIAARMDDDEDSDIVLVGHSQGGILSRLLAVMMTGFLRKPDVEPDQAKRPVRKAYKDFMAYEKISPRFPKLRGVVTLASPNSGALTYGQMSVAAALSAKVTKGLAWACGYQNLHDMSSDKIPRLLQYFQVPEVKYLSVSGSKINRYTTSHDEAVSDVLSLGLAEGVSSLIPNFSIRIDKPNDLLVEENSADLSNLLLPFEGVETPKHHNCYIDCTDVSHTSIHSNQHVRRKLLEWIGRI